MVAFTQKLNGTPQQQQLPIFSAKNELTKYVAKCSSVIVIGETASGKTTRIPEFLFEAGFARDQCIICSQPRRVAAITVATYMARELGSDLGELVGYSVRFDDMTSKSTKIKYATDGIILREAMFDNLLLKYSVIIIDEAHERSLQTDVLMSVAKSAQKQRAEKRMKPLKIVVMSATMDVDMFSEYFDDAPILYVEGRTYPVDTYHLAPDEQSHDYIWASMVSVIQVHRANPVDGDILLFLTGEEEIESAVRTLRSVAKEFDHETPGISVIPLYAALPPEAQMRAFKPPEGREVQLGIRRIIVSTNIAETSVTIPNIKYVIDSGKVKQKCYNPCTGIEYLSVRDESKAQAKQRAGRAGRLGPGECYHLMSREKFNCLRETTEAEILKCNLENAVLQLITLGVRDVLSFDFIERPPVDCLNYAVKHLLALEAIEETSHRQFDLTDLGKVLAKFPLPAEYSLALYLSQKENCLDDMLSVVSMLSVENVFLTRDRSKETCDKQWSKFQHPAGDIIGYLLVFRQFNQSSSKKNFCFENSLSFRNLSMAYRIRNQINQICRSLNWKFGSCGSGFDKLRLCLSEAFRLKVAVLGTEKKYYTLVGRVEVDIHPTSTLFKCLPSAVVYNELVKTTRTYMRSLCIVNEDWVEKLK